LPEGLAKLNASKHSAILSSTTATMALIDDESPPIQIYAELLLNIRTISLVIVLQTASNHETTAVLSADGHSVTVTHDGHSASISLPTQMEGGGSAALDLPSTPAKDLTLRLQLQEKSPGLLRLDDLGRESCIPWMSNEMMAMHDSRLLCRYCSVVILNTSSKIKEWRDLPNESWAEMMEFWHCHKPHEDSKNHDESSQTKGYSATQYLQIESGRAFVSPSYFLVKPSDCSNVELKVS
jgi:ubiquitin-protein ligase E3 D